MSTNGLALLRPDAPPPPHPADDPGYLLEEFSVPNWTWLRRLLGLPLLQGKPKPVPPRVRPLRPEQPVGHGPFKCRYCGRYGQPGACAGCGAPNAPVAIPRPLFPDNRVVRMFDTGIITPNEARVMEGRPLIPEFPMVKR